MLSYIRSSVGLRSNNEDYALDAQIGSYKLFVIADGMGGENDGELASKTACETVKALLTEKLADNPSISDSEISDVLNNAFQETNKAILKLCANKGLRDSDMGTTLTLALIKERKAYVCHIGDSRAYLKHGSSLTRLTKDHVLDGDSNQLVRFLGVNNYVNPDFYSYNIMYGDLFVLCTDGAYRNLSDKTIIECLKLHNKLEICADNLFAAAMEAGSEDNMTVLLANIRP